MADLWYKGYTGSIEVSSEDDCYYGQILDIDDLVTYSGASIDALMQSFQDAVDDYIVTCLGLGRKPKWPSRYWGLKS
jgi:predicted HicB family RNase H-like nuclease